MNVNKPVLLELEKLPLDTRVLVIAPHPDDEAFGCGGAILRHKLMGHYIHLIVLTDGSEGIKSKELGRQEIIRIRKEEAKRAQVILGIDELEFYDAIDKKLSHDTKIINKLKDSLLKVNPTYIYVPHYKDKHIDHYYSNILLEKCKDILIEINPVIMAYEVWSFIDINSFLDISDLIIRKLKSIKCYESQLKQMNYIQMIKGLNMYRGSQADYFSKRLIGKEITYAEGYFKTTPKDYLLNLNLREMERID